MQIRRIIIAPKLKDTFFSHAAATQYTRTFGSSSLSTMYRCTFCAAMFANNHLLNLHEERHRRLYACRVCKLHYPTRFALFRHTKRTGHYIKKEEVAALPRNHHVPFKGRDLMTRQPGQFGRLARHQSPPRKQRELTRRQVMDLYRPRLADTRVVDCGSRRSVRLNSLSTTNSSGTSTESRPAANHSSRKSSSGQRSYSTIDVVSKPIPRKRKAASSGGPPPKRGKAETMHKSKDVTSPSGAKKDDHSPTGAKSEADVCSPTGAEESPRPRPSSADEPRPSTSRRRHTTKFVVLSDSDSDTE